MRILGNLPPNKILQFSIFYFPQLFPGGIYPHLLIECRAPMVVSEAQNLGRPVGCGSVVARHLCKVRDLDMTLTV